MKKHPHGSFAALAHSQYTAAIVSRSQIQHYEMRKRMPILRHIIMDLPSDDTHNPERLRAFVWFLSSLM